MKKILVTSLTPKQQQQFKKLIALSQSPLFLIKGSDKEAGLTTKLWDSQYKYPYFPSIFRAKYSSIKGMDQKSNIIFKHLKALSAAKEMKDVDPQKSDLHMLTFVKLLNSMLPVKKDTVTMLRTISEKLPDCPKRFRSLIKIKDLDLSISEAASGEKNPIHLSLFYQVSQILLLVKFLPQEFKEKFDNPYQNLITLLNLIKTGSLLEAIEQIEALQDHSTDTVSEEPSDSIFNYSLALAKAWIYFTQGSLINDQNDPKKTILKAKQILEKALKNLATQFKNPTLDSDEEMLIKLAKLLEKNVLAEILEAQ